jgi:protein gp37
MGDLFHPYSPQNQILAVKDMAKATPQHIHIFLTQNTSRLREFNPWPPNCWVGTTITNQEHMNERVGYLLNADAKVRFISHEPLMSEIKQSQAWWKKVSPLLHWTIIGDMTGPGAVKLNLSWIFNLVGQYREAGVPIFLKNNCPWPGAKKIQEWPA